MGTRGFFSRATRSFVGRRPTRLILDIVSARSKSYGIFNVKGFRRPTQAS